MKNNWNILVKQLKQVKYSFTLKLDKSLDIDMNREIAVLEKMEIPQNNFKRSRFQFYLGRNQKKKIENFASDIISIFGILVLCILIGIKFLISRNEKDRDNCGYDAVYISNTRNMGIMPRPLLNKYKIINVPFAEGLVINLSTIKFLKKTFRYGSHNPSFVFRTIVNISNYCYAIKKYSPQVIITAYESAFTSSLLTEYCHQENIKHINIMHGEKLFNMNTTFFSFDDCYVWDEYYIDLFKREKAKIGNYYIYNPWIKESEVNQVVTKKIDIKFYLAVETRETLIALQKIVNRLQAIGLSVKIRLHPVGIFDKVASELFSGDIIEDKNEMNIIDSLNETSYVVARYSTVLFQGYSMGKNIIIDDVTNPNIYNKLKNLDYIMINKKHEILSEFLEKI